MGIKVKKTLKPKSLSILKKKNVRLAIQISFIKYMALKVQLSIWSLWEMVAQVK